MTGVLSDLTHQVALLAAPWRFTVAVRLLEANDATSIELRASESPDGRDFEYRRQISMLELERRGAPEVASEFVRETRVAFSVGMVRGPQQIRRIGTGVRSVKARSDGDAKG